MFININRLENFLSNKSLRRFTLIILDLIFLDFSILISLFFNSQKNGIYFEEYYWLFIYSNLICLFIYFLTNHYRGITKYIGSKFIYELFFKNALLIIILSFLDKL